VRLCQVALSVTDLRRAHGWYREVLGLEPAGGTNLFAGPLASMVQGLPRAASTCWWLLDRQDFFQLELFEFRSPLVRRLPRDWRPSDIGYSALSVHVADLDAALARAAAAGSPVLSEPLGEAGRRRACVRDPDGTVVELMEDDPRGPERRERPRAGVPAAIRAVTLSVPDLERSERFLGGVLGLASAAPIHGPAHEALWGLAGARCERRALWAGDVLIELARYSDPAPRPRPEGYRISDQGIVNVAFGFRSRRGFDAAVARCRAAGIEGNGPPLRLGAWSVVYVNDEDGFSFELLHVEPWYERRMGFRPQPAPRLAPFAGRTPAGERRRRRFRKAIVTGAAGGIGRELCRLAAEDGTELVLLDRDEGALAALAGALEAPSERIAADMSDLESLDGVAARLAAEHGDADLLIACAGLDRAQSLLAFDWRRAREDFAVNALANLVLLQHLAPAMAGRGRGHVTAVISLAGLVGLPYEAAYSGSKAALAAVVESARAELGPRGVTFTAVFPGFVDTPMFRANAFRHTYSIPARDAAERIYMASLRRRPQLSFPARERVRIEAGRLLPASLRARLARAAMKGPPAEGAAE